MPDRWKYFRSLSPDQLVDPLASADCIKHLPSVPDMLLSFDTTELEDGLRRWRNAPDLSFLRESGVRTKRWVSDTTVSWPAEAVRRKVLELISAAGFDEFPAVQAMSDRLAAYAISRVAQDAEEEELVFWKGDVCGEVADGTVEVRWKELESHGVRTLATRLLPVVQDSLELAVLDLKIATVEWCHGALENHAAGHDGGGTCTICAGPATQTCAGLAKCNAPVADGLLWDRCRSPLCGSCGSDLGLPSRPLRFCQVCRPTDPPPVSDGRAAGNSTAIAAYSPVLRFGTSSTNSDGFTLTPASIADVHFIVVDLGDQLPVPDDLCQALGLPLGSVEANQCVLLGTALAFLGWCAGPPELMGLPSKDVIYLAAQKLRRRTFSSGRKWLETLGTPAFPLCVPEGEVRMQAHDAWYPRHDKDMHHALVLLHDAFAGRVLHTLRSGSQGTVQQQVIEGPTGSRSALGNATGGILLHDSHVQAVLPLTGPPAEEGWGPVLASDPEIGAPFLELGRRLSMAGSLMPAVSTLSDSAILELVESRSDERSLGPKDLLLCPYCKSDKRRGAGRGLSNTAPGRSGVGDRHSRRRDRGGGWARGGGGWGATLDGRSRHRGIRR
jgi:hypothetical protein